MATKTRKAPARTKAAAKAPKAAAKAAPKAAAKASRPAVPRRTKYVYDFEQGNRDMKDLLGGKGANLGEMTNLGLPVPPGFTITTRACNEYLRQGGLPEGVMDEVGRHMKALEKKMGRRFGDAANPLLVSVRSGAKFSMPGMMDTVLNLGLNDTTVAGLAEHYGDERFAADAYRRLVQMFGKIVMGVAGERFEHEIEAAKLARRVTSDTELGAEDLTGLMARFKEIAATEAGVAFPEDPMTQLEMAIRAVFESWNG